MKRFVFLMLTLLGAFSMTSCCAYTPTTERAIAIIDDDVGKKFNDVGVIESQVVTMTNSTDAYYYAYGLHDTNGEEAIYITETIQNPERSYETPALTTRRVTIRCDGL